MFPAAMLSLALMAQVPPAIAADRWVPFDFFGHYDGKGTFVWSKSRRHEANSPYFGVMTADHPPASTDIRGTDLDMGRKIAEQSLPKVEDRRPCPGPGPCPPDQPPPDDEAERRPLIPDPSAEIRQGVVWIVGAILFGFGVLGALAIVGAFLVGAVGLVVWFVRSRRK